MSDWQTVKFGDVVAINPARPLMRKAEAPYIAMEHLTPFYRALPSPLVREFSGSGSRFRNGDTLLARITPCLENGKTAYVDCLQEGEVAQGSTEFIVLSGLEKITDNLFIYYLMRNETIRTYAIQHMEGSSGRQRVPASALSDLIVDLPALGEQCAIARILGDFDTKIELNRRMNENLQALARTLFKSWFVEFIPFGGLMPDDWRVGVLSDVASNPRRRVQPKDIPSETPYLGLDDMPRRSIALYNYGYSGEVTSNKSAYREGEILFGKLRPYFHKVGVAAQDGVCSTDILVVTPNAPLWHGFVTMLVSSDEFVDYTNSHSDGTRMPRTSWNDMARYETLIPDVKTATKFNEIVAPLLAKINGNIKENWTLAQMRDALLPRLLSGEIRVNMDAFAMRPEEN